MILSLSWHVWSKNGLVVLFWLVGWLVKGLTKFYMNLYLKVLILLATFKFCLIRLKKGYQYFPLLCQNRLATFFTLTITVQQNKRWRKWCNRLKKQNIPHPRPDFIFLGGHCRLQEWFVVNWLSRPLTGKKQNKRVPYILMKQTGKLYFLFIIISKRSIFGSSVWTCAC